MGNIKHEKSSNRSHFLLYCRPSSLHMRERGVPFCIDNGRPSRLSSQVYWMAPSHLSSIPGFCISVWT